MHGDAIGFERHDVVGPLVDDPPSRLALAVHGVHGHCAALDVEKVGKHAQRRELLCSRSDAYKAQRQSACRGEGVDHPSPRGPFPVVSASRPGKRRHASREGLWIEEAKQPSEGTAARNTSLKHQKLAQKWLLRTGKELEVDTAFRAAQAGRQRNHPQLQHITTLRILASRIWQIAKTVQKQNHAASPKMEPPSEANSPPKRDAKYEFPAGSPRH